MSDVFFYLILIVGCNAVIAFIITGEWALALVVALALAILWYNRVG